MFPWGVVDFVKSTLETLCSVNPLTDTVDFAMIFISWQFGDVVHSRTVRQICVVWGCIFILFFTIFCLIICYAHHVPNPTQPKWDNTFASKFISWSFLEIVDVRGIKKRSQILEAPTEPRGRWNLRSCFGLSNPTTWRTTNELLQTDIEKHPWERARQKADWTGGGTCFYNVTGKQTRELVEEETPKQDTHGTTPGEKHQMSRKSEVTESESVTTFSLNLSASAVSGWS